MQCDLRQCEATERAQFLREKDVFKKQLLQRTTSDRNLPQGITVKLLCLRGANCQSLQMLRATESCPLRRIGPFFSQIKMEKIQKLTSLLVSVPQEN